MAITGTALTTNFSTTSGVGPYTTASVTPSASQPVLLAVLLAPASGVTSPIPTISGCGLTWSLVTHTTASSGTRTLFLFLGIGASPTTGAITITGDGSATFNSCLWQVTQLAGVATGVANGVVQSVNAKPASATSVNVAFGSTITAGNATFAGVAVGTGSSPTAGSGWTAEGSTNAPATGLLGEFAASAQQNIKASWTGSAGSFVVGVEMAAASTGGTNATVSGTVGKVTATAPAGTVKVTGGTFTVPGVAAAVAVAALAGSVTTTTAPPAATFPTYVRPPDPYTRAIRNGVRLSYSVDASYNGALVAGATGLQPTGGQITDTTKPGVRRTLNLELASEPGLFDLLEPIGTTLTVTAKVTYTGNTGVLIPMGVFDVDDQSLDEGGGKITLTAPDKWQRIVRAKFLGPASCFPGQPVTQQIALMVQQALGSSETVQILSRSAAQTSTLTWTDFDRAKAILDLAAGAGLWVYFDRFGVCTIADLPTVRSSQDWLVDASPSGVLVSLDRSRSRTSTYNLVVVDSSASSGPTFDSPQYVWDSDPTSPTYAGPDPVNHPEQAGPFGVSAYHFATPLTLDDVGAQRTGASILARTVGLASQVSLSTVPNPAMDAFDSLGVLPPQQRYDIPRDLETHVADTVTHSLTVDGGTHVDGRSTRTDAYS